MVLSFLITGLLSALLAGPLAGPLAEIMTAARQFAAGNLAARIRVHRSDELGELARILNQSASQLQERLTENARDRARSEASSPRWRTACWEWTTRGWSFSLR